LTPENLIQVYLCCAQVTGHSEELGVSKAKRRSGGGRGGWSKPNCLPWEEYEYFLEKTH